VTVSTPIPSTAEQTWPSRPYAWYVVAVLMLAYAFSIVDRTGLGLLVQPIEAELHISDSQMGLLQGLAFAVFYSLLGLPLGLLADRFNRRAVISGGIVVWSLATVACGLSSGFSGLFLSRLGVGAGEATLNPSGASMIADYFPPKERSKAYGVYAVGTSIGSGMAFLLVAGAIGWANHLRIAIPHVFGGLSAWKIVFLLLGAPGLLVGAVFALTVKEPVRRELPAPTSGGALAPLARQLSKAKVAYFGVIAGTVLNFTAIYALVAWFPTYLIREHAMSAVEIGRLLGTFGVPCGIVSCLGSGWIAAWLDKRGRADAAVLVALGGVVLFTVAGVAAALAPTALLAVILYCVLSLSTNCAAVSSLTALNRITPNTLRGQVVAIFSLSAGLIAVSIGPLSVGLLSDHVFGAAHGVGKALVVVFVITGVLGFAAFAWARPSYRKLAGLSG
jgi:MFS family permease